MSDFHNRVFSEGTKLKLKILKSYAKAWLPVFTMQEWIKDIFIYDFYCGPGFDLEKKPGSPQIISEVIKEQYNSASKKNIKVWLNDSDKDKIESCKSIKFPPFVEVTYSSECGESCLKSLAKKNPPHASAHFLYIDPTGLSHYPTIFDIIDRYPCADFLLFIPANQMSRFAETDGFQNKLPGFKKNKQEEIPRDFCSYCQKEYNIHPSLHLIPFSIKSGKNIHGLIFGSKHILGLDKYLHQIWEDTENGIGNFSIKGDLPQMTENQLSLFEMLPDDYTKSNKVKNFEEVLKQKILTMKLRTNRDIYFFSIKASFLPRHAKKVLKNLKNSGKIKNVPGLSYKTACKKEPVKIELIS